MSLYVPEFIFFGIYFRVRFDKIVFGTVKTYMYWGPNMTI